jgi:hypothetical protein
MSTDFSHLKHFGARRQARYLHSVQFYQDDAALVSTVTASLVEAIKCGHSSIVIATASHVNEFAREVNAKGVDLASSSVRRRFFTLDASETLSQFMDAGLPDPAAFSEIMGHTLVKAKSAAENGRVFAFGEMVALLWADGNAQAAIALERLWNDLAHTNSFALHCAYPLSGFQLADSSHLMNICAEHSHVIAGDNSNTGITI